MKLYLFKRASDGAWIFGESTDHEHPAGVCRIAPSTDKTKVSIIYFQKNEANQNKLDIPVTSIYKEDETAYADFAALKAGYAGFFFSVGGSGGSAYTPYVVPIEQIDGRLAFTVGEEIDLTKDTIAVEGKFTHTPTLDYVVANVAGIGTFTFTVAPTEQLVLRYIKK
ncbi:MAG: hypothetical protein PHT07_20980 [Paludibacter sp.]|nr:hypothetical protein [Paludibacter sp.]